MVVSQVSASQKDGAVTVTAANLSLTESCEVELRFDELTPAQVDAVVLSGEVHAHNTFDDPDAVTERKLAASVDGHTVAFTLPVCGVAAVTVK